MHAKVTANLMSSKMRPLALQESKMGFSDCRLPARQFSNYKFGLVENHM